MQRKSCGEIAFEVGDIAEIGQNRSLAPPIADSACGYSAVTLMPADAAVLSIEFKVNMLAPAKGDAIIARARVIRAGRTIVVTRADVYAQSGDQEKLVAAMQGTMMVVTGRDISD